MITTLVPAFKPDFFPSLLRALDAQSDRPRRVIISDDTPTGAFQAAALQDGNIRSLLQRIRGSIIRGPRSGYHDNVRHLLAAYRQAPTAFFHIHLDDDEIAPDFYRQHLRAHGRFHSLCGVSRRVILKQRRKDSGVPAIPQDLQTVAPGLLRVTMDRLVKSFVLDGDWNWLGELSCMTLRREFLDLEPDFNSFGGQRLEGLNDIATLLKSASQSDILFLTEPLGAFRISPNSISARQGFFFSLSILGGLALAMVLQRQGRIGRQDVLTAGGRIAQEWRSHYGEDAVHTILLRLRRLGTEDYDRFAQAALAFWAAYKDLSRRQGSLSTRADLIAALAAEDGQELMRRSSPGA